MNLPLRFGLIGYGAWGQHHARAITETPGAELVAVAARSEASRQQAKADHNGVSAYADFHELAKRDDIDVIDIVLPTFLHHEAAMAALVSGKHVLLEKPMAPSMEQCQEMFDTARANRLLLAIGHELRLSSQWGEIRNLIKRGAIGTPQYVLVELSRKPYRGGADGWRLDISRVGNWILEEPIHFFDLARWYLSEQGNPASVFAAANARDPEHPELQDNFSAIMQWDNGSYAVVSQTLAAFEHHQTIKVSGTHGAIWASWSGALDRTDSPTCTLRFFDGEEVKDLPLHTKSGEIFELRAEIAMVVDCLRSGNPPIAGAEDGFWSTAMCLAAQQSVEQAVPVRFDSFFASSEASS